MFVVKLVLNVKYPVLSSLIEERIEAALNPQVFPVP